MDIDSITPEEALERLIQMISIDGPNQTAFSALKSLEDINLDKSVLKLQFKILDKVPTLLFSEQIYNDEKDLKIEMPIDRLCTNSNSPDTIALIGVSGCGKTRTCFDYCRRYWGLYFDCTLDSDLKRMLVKVQDKIPDQITEENQIAFEKESSRLIRCLITGRMLVLQTLRKLNPKLDFFQWLCIQRSRRTQILFEDIFIFLAALPWSVSSVIYSNLIIPFKREGRIIFDESQHLLSVLMDTIVQITQLSDKLMTTANLRFRAPSFRFFLIS